MSRDVKTTTQIEGPSSTTRGIADCLLSEMWFLRAQGRGGCSRVLIVPLQDVRVEDETADEQPQNLTSCGYKVATEEMVPEQSMIPARSQATAEPESKPAKRRRLTGARYANDTADRWTELSNC